MSRTTTYRFILAVLLIPFTFLLKGMGVYALDKFSNIPKNETAINYEKNFSNNDIYTDTENNKYTFFELNQKIATDLKDYNFLINGSSIRFFENKKYTSTLSLSSDKERSYFYLNNKEQIKYYDLYLYNDDWDNGDVHLFPYNLANSLKPFENSGFDYNAMINFIKITIDNVKLNNLWTTMSGYEVSWFQKENNTLYFDWSSFLFTNLDIKMNLNGNKLNFDINNRKYSFSNSIDLKDLQLVKYFSDYSPPTDEGSFPIVDFYVDNLKNESYNGTEYIKSADYHINFSEFNREKFQYFYKNGLDWVEITENNFTQSFNKNVTIDVRMYDKTSKKYSETKSFTTDCIQQKSELYKDSISINYGEDLKTDNEVPSVSWESGPSDFVLYWVNFFNEKIPIVSQIWNLIEMMNWDSYAFNDTTISADCVNDNSAGSTHCLISTGLPLEIDLNKIGINKKIYLYEYLFPFDNESRQIAFHWIKFFVGILTFFICAKNIERGVRHQ